MSIATEIERLKKAKNDLFRAVTAKGGVLDLSQKLDEYASGVDTIPSAVEGSGKYRVRFFDYDGTVLHEYDADDFLALSAMPANPTHTGLTSQGWNWSLADAQDYVEDYIFDDDLVLLAVLLCSLIISHTSI